MFAKKFVTPAYWQSNPLRKASSAYSFPTLSVSQLPSLVIAPVQIKSSLKPVSSEGKYPMEDFFVRSSMDFEMQLAFAHVLLLLIHDLSMSRVATQCRPLFRAS
jgi:hypothetical protein